MVTTNRNQARVLAPVANKPRKQKMQTNDSENAPNSQHRVVNKKDDAVKPAIDARNPPEAVVPPVAAMPAPPVPLPVMAEGDPADLVSDDLVGAMQNMSVGVHTESVEWKVEQKEMDKMFDEQAREKLQNLPELDQPEELITKLLPHQMDGLRWMHYMETGDQASPFVRSKELKDGTIAKYCRLTGRRLQSPDEEQLQGMILADDMGLGKTIQTIALILSNPPAERARGKMTLIVCPKSVISNWRQQIRDHVEEGELSVAVYEGPKRDDKIRKLARKPVGVLLATYETLAWDLKKSDKADDDEDCTPPIFGVTFHRIVLDEAHKIRNSSGQAAKALFQLDGKHKLCLSGTPFVNNPDDIQSLFQFIGLKPLGDKAHFKYYVTEPIKHRRKAGLVRLRAAVSFVTLRRTKSIVEGVELTNKTISIKSMEFDTDGHKSIYDSIHLVAHAAFHALGDDEDDKASREYYQVVFEMIGRARQACCHGNMVPAHRRALFKELAEEFEIVRTTQRLTPEQTDSLMNRLMVFKKVEGEVSDGEDDLTMVENEAADDEELGPSPKVRAVLAEIDRLPLDEKAVVFSQYCTFLDIIQAELARRGYECVRIDGSMSSDARLKSLDAFNDDDNVKVILCSLNAAGTGINLTRGNHCYVMDPWWNEATESQAMDRVHRVGQERDVEVVRFVMKGTIEERFIQYQKTKATLGRGALEKISAKDERRAKLASMKDLFDEIEEDHEYGEWIDEDE